MEADLPANRVEKLRALFFQDTGIIRPGIVRHEVEAPRPCETVECYFGDLTTTEEKMMKKYEKFVITPL